MEALGHTYLYNRSAVRHGLFDILCLLLTIVNSKIKIDKNDSVKFEFFNF